MTIYTRRINRRQAHGYLDYRVPMLVTELLIFNRRDGYYACPRCHITLEREFSTYCDRCGQRLNWSQYQSAKQIYVR